MVIDYQKETSYPGLATSLRINNTLHLSIKGIAGTEQEKQANRSSDAWQHWHYEKVTAVYVYGVQLCRLNVLIAICFSLQEILYNTVHWCIDNNISNYASN